MEIENKKLLEGNSNSQEEISKKVYELEQQVNQLNQEKETAINGNALIQKVTCNGCYH